MGRGNYIYVGENCVVHKAKIYIRGNSNHIHFSNNSVIGRDCTFRCEGDNISIYIGSGTTVTRNCHFAAQENGSSITLGKDCMLSNTIIIRTSDSHPIYDENGNRTNPAKSVVIGNHVWIAPNSTVMKGVTIGDNAIIASNTLVTKDVKPHTLVAGIPAKTVKEYVKWTREQLF